MRVISGLLKGRNINGYNIEGTRPTMDKIKESLFAMIQNHIKDSICLDLFAGSGSLGIEAISNGAKFCYFIDNSKQAVKVINDNIDKFNIKDKSIVLLSDYQKALRMFIDQNVKFDLIFLDPPYKEKIISNILKYIDENNLLNNGGHVICEFMDEDLLDKEGTLILIKHKKYSDKQIKIYKDNEC